MSVDRQEDLKQYKATIERLKRIFSVAKEGLWHTDHEGRVTFLNRSFYTDYEIDLDQYSIDSWLSVVHPEDRADFIANYERQINERLEVVKSQYRVIDRYGNTRWIEALGVAEFDEDGSMRFMEGSHADITEEKRYEARLMHMAYRDRVTDLYDREHFSTLLEETLEEVGEGALFHVNIQRFSLINDTYGHATGDILLAAVADRLRLAAESDEVLSRLTSDQFAVLVPGITEVDRLTERAEAYVADLNRCYEIGELFLDVEVLIGIVRFPRDGATVEELMQNVSLTGQHARRNRDQLYVFFNTLNKPQILRRLYIENHMRIGLDRGEFHVVYQPIVCLKTQKTLGHEALLRWHHPELGPVSPGEFIPIAESNRFIAKLGRYVLEKACRFIADRRKTHPGERVSVNVSVIQILGVDFTQQVLGVLAQVGLPPDALVLEITESVILDKNPSTLAKLHRLRRAGVRISLDDFGTGFSSIHNLIELPLDELKIDRSVVLKMIEDEDVAFLIRSVVGFAERRQFLVVIEGIENQMMLEKAIGSGANAGQGYHFARPKKFEMES